MMQKALAFALLSSALASEEFLSRKGEKSGVSASCLIKGWADDAQQSELVRLAQDCFTWNPVDTSNLGQLQGPLGDAIKCVTYNLKNNWGWEPELVGSGSNTGGPYDTYGADLTIIGVDTSSGRWQFSLRKAAGAGGGDSGSGHVQVTGRSLHRGDATSEQETDLINFAESCFSKSDVDTSNLGNLQGTLGANVGCVLQKCQEKWGWKPESTNSGSDNGGPYDAYGLGATVIGVESPSGKWEFVLRLKF